MSFKRKKVLWKHLDELLSVGFVRRVIKKFRVNKTFHKKCIVWMFAKNTDVEFFYEFGTPSLFFQGYNKDGVYVEKEIFNEEELQNQIALLEKEFV